MKIGSKDNVDLETGEVTRQYFNVRVKKHSINFVLFFNSILPKIEEVKSEIGVLMILAMNSRTGEGRCDLSTEARQTYAEELGIKVNNFNAQLHRLQKKGIVKLEKGSVFINPNYVWKGNVVKREQLLESKFKEIIKDASSNQ